VSLLRTTGHSPAEAPSLVGERHAHLSWRTATGALDFRPLPPGEIRPHFDLTAKAILAPFPTLVAFPRHDRGAFEEISGGCSIEAFEQSIQADGLPLIPVFLGGTGERHFRTVAPAPASRTHTSRSQDISAPLA
jgi:hypothetical protein